MYPQPDPYAPVRPPAPARRRRRGVVLAAAGTVAAVAVVSGVAFAVGRTQTVSGSGSAIAAQPATDRQGWGPRGYGSAGGGTTTSATAAQELGVVDIDTVLGYQHGAAAGTGMILTSTGEVLTNNHVIDGATSISVTVVTTGKTYTATVVGTDPTEDIAVIQLENASGLQTARLGDSSTVRVGDTVTGVGNAGGTGGTPNAATGQVDALDQSITASDQSGQNTETLTGLIETDAQIVAGDSGGPLYDASGRVIGIDTAASTNGGLTNAAYAIPISHAVSIAGQIENGVQSSTVHLGYPGLLGVSAADSGVAGAAITGVVAGGPAARAGISAGDVVTAIDGTNLTSSAALRAALAGAHPGQAVTVTWTDSSGQTHRASVILIAGPAD